MQPTEVLGDRYELGPVLGVGGMARVYRATDRMLDRPVAVKVLAEPYDRDQGFVQRFQREARAAARLNHPSIVSVYDSGSDAGIHFIVMELVEGETLDSLIKRDGPVPTAEATRVGIAVARALAAAHERGVVHRDVKPSNVMLTAEDGVKVLDFGIAHASGAEDITRSGLVLGSASYLSPEQAQGASGDERSDIYGLGCVLYQMLTGRRPFLGADPIASLYQHVNERPAPPSTIHPVPAGLERIVLRCLEKEPASRFASAGEIETVLASAPSDEPTSTMELPPVADEPTVPVRRSESETTLSGPPAASVAHRRPPPNRSWRVTGVAVAVLLVTGLVLLLVDPVRLPSAAELREARREARAEASVAPDTMQTSPSVTEPRSVGEAADRLLEAIETAAAGGEILDEDVTAELLDDAEEVKEAHAIGDGEWLQIELPDLIQEIETARERGEVSDEAGAEIGGALEALVAAIDDDPLESTSPSQDDEDDDD